MFASSRVFMKQPPGLQHETVSDLGTSWQIQVLLAYLSFRYTEVYEVSRLPTVWKKFQIGLAEMSDAFPN